MHFFLAKLVLFLGSPKKETNFIFGHRPEASVENSFRFQRTKIPVTEINFAGLKTIAVVPDRNRRSMCSGIDGRTEPRAKIAAHPASPLVDYERVHRCRLCTRNFESRMAEWQILVKFIRI